MKVKDVKLFTELDKICKKHGTNLADVYWKQAVVDIIDSIQTSGREIADTDLDLLTQQVLDDGFMWETITETVEQYLEEGI